MTAALAGCSNPAGNLMTAPSELPGSLDAHGGAGGNARYYGAEITPVSVAAGSTTSFSITIENCNGGATCDGAHTTADNQQIGHATVVIPAGFTGVANLVVTTSDPADGWTASVVAGAIVLQAPAGNKRLSKGESVTVTFDAVAPCVSGSAEWTAAAYQDAVVGDTDTPYTLTGAQPAVGVTGSCATECSFRGQGYWEHHPLDWPGIGAGIALGNRVYNAAELLSILQKNPVAGNGLIALAHQMIAARLNIAAGEDGSSIAAALAAADALVADQVVPPVGSGSLLPAQTGDLTETLEAFNDQCED
jgi:hypothetical protein